MANMEVVILSAPSGSGKSTIARQMEAVNPLGTVVVSADDYFVAPDGTYSWSADRLGAAHAWCFAKYLTALQNRHWRRVVVDNTNLNYGDVSPYVLAAEAYGIKWEILQVGCDPEVAAARNVHGLTRSKVRKQHERLMNFYCPQSWWSRVSAIGDLNYVSNLARRNSEQEAKKKASDSGAAQKDGNDAA